MKFRKKYAIPEMFISGNFTADVICSSDPVNEGLTNDEWGNKTDSSVF